MGREEAESRITRERGGSLSSYRSLRMREGARGFWWCSLTEGFESPGALSQERNQCHPQNKMQLK